MLLNDIKIYTLVLYNCVGDKESVILPLNILCDQYFINGTQQNFQRFWLWNVIYEFLQLLNNVNCII